jgi:hypothetical protein
MKDMGKWLVCAGLIMSAAGALLWKWPGMWKWVGHLPGDIRWERPGFKLYIPLTTILVASVMLRALLWLIQRWNR